MRPTPKQLLFIIGIAVVALAFIVTQTMIKDAPGSVSRTGDVITRVVTTAEPDTSAEYPLRLLEGDDADHESAHIFQSLDGIQGVATASLDITSLALTVAYDSSIVSEGIIRSALASAGYLAMTAADATPMELAEDGSVQRIEVVDDHGFKPAFIRAKSGVPAEIVFGPGTECRVSIKFPQLGIEADISQGATVQLPAMEPGTYDILCGGDGSEGSIVVE
ncbi:MAG: cupredoxin domain-containing protein [Coriobacteriia bacterium]|nr:cupredoxin domain-containing protein [Coriobacteriia bacterium]